MRENLKLGDSSVTDQALHHHEFVSGSDRFVSGLASPPLADRAARLITNLLYPHWVVTVLLGLVAIKTSAGPVQFFQWWVLAVLFVAVIPYGFIVYALRRGRISDRNITRGSERAFPFITAMLSFAMGAGVLLALSAPREVLAVAVGAFVGLLIALPLASRLKLSIHTAGVSGTVIILFMVYGPLLLLLTPLVALVGWARIKIEHHTLVQVAAGALIGTLVAAGVFLVVTT